MRRLATNQRPSRNFFPSNELSNLFANAILVNRYFPRIPFFCGDDGARTRDLVVANHALSQLSYIPDQMMNSE